MDTGRHQHAMLEIDLMMELETVEKAWRVLGGSLCLMPCLSASLQLFLH